MFSKTLRAIPNSVLDSMLLLRQRSVIAMIRACEVQRLRRGLTTGEGTNMQQRREMKRPATAVAQLALTALQAAGAIAGGIGLVQDPVKNIGLPTSLLEGSPFKDYLIPGLILLIVVGLFSLIVFVGLLLRWKAAWWLSLASGGGLVIWIIAEVALLGYLPGAGIGMQIAFGLVGVAIVVLALARPTRRLFGIGGTERRPSGPA
jgi:hypothetical protein